jgi:hypothetical protein
LFVSSSDNAFYLCEGPGEYARFDDELSIDACADFGTCAPYTRQ